jgi:hypothetical protein
VIGNVSVTIQRDTPGGLDQYGDPIEADVDSPETFDLEGCAVAPRASTETTGRAREGQIIGLTLYCPPGADIVRDDRVVITEGPHVGTYEVEGDPGDWQSGLTGWGAGMTVELTAAVG